MHMRSLFPLPGYCALIQNVLQGFLYCFLNDLPDLRVVSMLLGIILSGVCELIHKHTSEVVYSQVRQHFMLP